MDPVILAVITSAVTLLASESLKGAASAAGRDAWGRIKALFGWQSTLLSQSCLALSHRS